MSRERHPHHSTHRVGRKLVSVPRRFQPEHLAAGYHLAEFSAPSSPEHDLHGAYQGRDGTITVRHLAQGPTAGPEFEIELEDGMKITTLHEEAVLFHLAQFGAVEVEQL